jgi:hypothetical protein
MYAVRQSQASADRTTEAWRAVSRRVATCCDGALVIKLDDSAVVSRVPTVPIRANAGEYSGQI